MEEFDRQHPPNTQSMNRPPQSGHWGNWQAPNPGYQPPQAATYAQSPAPAPAQPVPSARSPPLGATHGTPDSNPYGIPPMNTNTDAVLPTSSGRWQYQPEPAAPPARPVPSARPQAPATGVALEEPRRGIGASRLGTLPKRPVSLMDANANTRLAATAPTHTIEEYRDEGPTSGQAHQDFDQGGVMSASSTKLRLLLGPHCLAKIRVLALNEIALDQPSTTGSRQGSMPLAFPDWTTSRVTRDVTIGVAIGEPLISMLPRVAFSVSTSSLSRYIAKRRRIAREKAEGTRDYVPRPIELRSDEIVSGVGKAEFLNPGGSVKDRVALKSL
ncbi:hypothetical protein FRC10_004740 [Ceratobasidium sp. 414]|nr:hypothetical protein FRC10_004740 [Ceratobasidium sp. 414]